MAQSVSSRKSRLWTKFGITEEQYDEILRNQGGGCAICGMTPEENGKALAVDHDHRGGDVRGLLCEGCNYKIGMMHEDANWLQRAGAYLMIAPALAVTKVIGHHRVPKRTKEGLEEVS